MTFADRLYLYLIWLRTWLSEYLRWKSVGAGKKIPAVFYGYDHIPKSSEEAFGGIVKIQDLQTSFPNHRRSPNLLYLVSSALPYFPLRMARGAKKAGARLIVNQNGVAYPGWHGPGWQKTNLPMKQLLEIADYVIYQSHFCKISADKYLGKVSHNNAEVLYNPVDTSVFCPVQNTERHGKQCMLIAGSHWSAYRIMTALETLEKVRRNISSVSLEIAGRLCWHKRESEALKEVKAYAERLGIIDCVKISGPYSQLQAPELLRKSSILLHTKYNDPCPRLVVEAMACGVPVVYSASGGVPELVGTDAGIGVPAPRDWEQDHPPDANQLAAGVEKIIHELDTYSAAARKRAVDSFDVRPWLDRHAEIFQGIL